MKSTRYDANVSSGMVIGAVCLDSGERNSPVPPIVDLESLREQLPVICSKLFHQVGSQQLEATYQRCLRIDLEEAGVRVIDEPEIKLTYKGNIVGTRRADLLLVLDSEEKAIVELKAVDEMKMDHRKQLEYYLHYADIDKGYLINFPHDSTFPSVDEWYLFSVARLRGLVQKVEHLLMGGVTLRPKNSPKKREVEVLEVNRSTMSTQEQENARQKKREQPKHRYGQRQKGTDCKICIKKGGFCHLHLDQKPKA